MKNVTAGIDFPLRRIPSTATCRRFQDTLVWCAFDSKWGLTYQKCRFCDRGIGDEPGLFKYAVRHYVCKPCLTHWKAR